MVDQGIEETTSTLFGNRGYHRFFLGERGKGSSFFDWLKPQVPSSLNEPELDITMQVQIAGGMRAILVVSHGLMFDGDLLPEDFYERLGSVREPVDYRYHTVFMPESAVDRVATELVHRWRTERRYRLVQWPWGNDFISTIPRGTELTTVFLGRTPLPDRRARG